MPRPSRNTDKLLIQVGRELLAETGVSGLSLRKVASKAGVNLGMFHYNFGSKRAFARSVLQDIYEDFFKGFSLETGGDQPALERLRRAVFLLARFARDNRRLFLAILHDVIEGEPESIRFAKDNIPRHLGILAALVRQCRREGVIRKEPVPSAVAFLASSVVMPVIALGAVERAAAEAPFGVPLSRLAPMMVSDAAIARRVDAALKGLAP